MNNLSQTPHKNTISAAEGQLHSYNQDIVQLILGKKTATPTKSIDIGEPEIPCKRKVPKNYDHGPCYGTRTFTMNTKVWLN